jgi:hypothetical protein
MAGAWIWFALTNRSLELIEGIGAGLALTFVGIPIIGIFLAGRINPLLIWLVIPILTFVFTALFQRVRRMSLHIHFDPVLGFATLIGLILGIFVYRQQIFTAFTADPFDAAAFHPDLIPLAQVAESMTSNGVAQGGLMSNWPVRYHFFSGLFSGTLDQTTINQPLYTLGGVVPLLSLVGISILVAVLVRQLVNNRYVPALAVLAVVLGRYIADPSGVNINFDSTSQIASTLILLFFAIQIINAGKSNWSNERIALLSITLIALTGTKFSAGAVGLGIVAFSLLFSLKSDPTKWIRISVVFLVSLVSLSLPVLVFMTGQNDSGILIPQNPIVSIMSTNVPAGALASGAVLATLLALLPSWSPSVIGVIRIRPALPAQSGIFIGAALAGILPLLLFENAAPNNYWFLTSASALVLPLSLVYVFQLTQRIKIEANRLFVIYITLTSSVIAISWAVLVANFPVLSDFAQITFIAVWLIIAIVLSAGYRALTACSYMKLLTITILWLGALSPIYMVVSETIVTRTKPIAEVIQSIPPDSSNVTLQPEASLPSIPELKEISEYLTSNVQPGSEIAFVENPLAIVTLMSETKPYISSQHYAEGLGPAGSEEEYQRRLQLLGSWKSDPKPNVTDQLCAEGVSVVITNRSSQDSKFDQFNPVNIDNWIVIQLPCSIR